MNFIFKRIYTTDKRPFKMKSYKFSNGDSLAWTMYDGESLNTTAYRQPSCDDLTMEDFMTVEGMKKLDDPKYKAQKCEEEDLKDVLMYEYAVVTWNNHPEFEECMPMKFDKITVGDVIRAVVNRHEKLRGNPMHICCLDALYYDEDEHRIHLVFGS